MDREMNRFSRFRFIHLQGESQWPLPAVVFSRSCRILAAEFLARLEYRVYAALLLDEGPSNGWKSTGCVPQDALPRTG